MKIGKKVSGGLMLAFVLIAGTAVAGAVFSFSQSFPQTNTPPAFMSACANSVSLNTTTPSSQAILLYNCGGSVAFKVNVSGNYTPTFSPAINSTGLNDIGLYPASSNTSGLSACAGISGWTELSSGVSLLLHPGSYNYCGDYTPSPGGSVVDTFTVVWSK